MSQLLPLAREKFATGVLDWTDVALTIKAVMLPASVVIDPDTHVYLDDISVGSRIATSGAIASRTATEGKCNGAAADFGIVSDSREVTQVVLFVDTGDESTSYLIAHIDDLMGDPFAPAGVQYLLYPDAVAGGFFTL